jgi:hypothetical protein
MPCRQADATASVTRSFTGTVVFTTPYTVPVLQQDYYCPTQSWTFTVNGHPGTKCGVGYRD